MQAIVFDDGQGRLSPLTDLRPSFAVRTGARTTLSRIEQFLPDPIEIAGLVVPESLAEIVSDSFELPVNEPISGSDPVLLINGRCPLLPERALSLSPGSILVERLGRDDPEAAVVAACVRPDAATAIIAGEIPDAGVEEIATQVLLRRPWDIRRFRDAAIAHDLDVLTGIAGVELPEGVIQRGRFPVVVRAGADIWPGVILDTTSGPIVIATGTTIRPGAIIVGPVFIGEDSTILERAHIKPHTAIGPRCKVGGEVGGTIFQGLANKAHEGHLGDSWIGEWVNIGAGTSNSNLLNTYGEVIAKAAVDGSHERTGQTFLGAIIGDHAKFAIGTRIMTGAVVHTGAMIASSKPVVGCVGPFTWATDRGETAFRLPRFVDTARVVMGRRGIEPSEAYQERLCALHRAASGTGSS